MWFVFPSVGDAISSMAERTHGSRKYATYLQRFASETNARRKLMGVTGYESNYDREFSGK